METILFHASQDADSLYMLESCGGGWVLALPEKNMRYLNLCMEVTGGHSQAFELQAFGGEPKPRVVVRFGLAPKIRAHVCLDLNWLDGHILFPGHPAGMQKIVVHGSRIAREEIRELRLVSMPGAQPVEVRLESMEWSETPEVRDKVSGQKQIDAFGQYALREWPGKVHDRESLNRTLRAEAEKESIYPGNMFTAWGGYRQMPMQAGTGFFSRVCRDGRWYLLDPDGHAFFSMGPDCVVARCDGRIDGLEEIVDLPGEDPELYEDMRRTDWENRRQGRLVSFERANLKAAFGRDWYSVWKRMVVGQLKRMGMNTLGNWSDPALYGAMPYVTSLERFPDTQHRIFRDFPDVLSPEYAEDARACAQSLKARAEDPWMIGYFLRNEPSWAFVDELVIADEVLRDPEMTWCKRALIRFLQDRYKAPEALSRAWNHAFASFEDLEKPLDKASALSAQAMADQRAFSGQLNRAYVEIPVKACREIDRNHMILGMRWAWISDPLLVSGWDCFDVFSINCYAQDPTPALERVRELKVDLPVMIGEFHFGALDRGLTATGLEAVENQAERAKAYRYYTERVAAHPQGVGCHWFQCYDQFALGRFDGENYQIGLMDICLQPYPDMAGAVESTARAVPGILTGAEEPFAERPRSLPMIAY